MPANDDTIFALASGQGKAGVAVIRVSGRNLDFLPGNIGPRFANLVDFYGLDNLIAIYFPAPNSFTGEDVVELHCHGGIAVINSIFDKLKSFGFRMAERGEFSRRAFDNGKMDLVEVDSMRALVDAKTESQRRRALKGLAGADSEVYTRWRDAMIELAALSAARLDYGPDDLPKDVNEKIAEKTAELADGIKKALNSRAKIIEAGFDIVLAGETNVGKSSLFNRLIGESRAIVSDIAGTTRDVISAELDIDGYLVRLSDTAGLREANDEIEKIGINMTNARLKDADLILWVYDKNTDEKKDGIVVVNKSDLITVRKSGAIYVSAKTGDGVPELMDLIGRKIHSKLDGAENDLAVNDRTKTHLRNAFLELEKVSGATVDLESEHIMNAANEIGRALGIIGTEEIYDSLFGQLCLGK
ncbi:MAG: tRNA uridine-5-carboxymethylaminomethyl(34) synthesis GTPase MnmE [Rickettsiales bacterium]|jgi:tRNA modification GTPase|nr:tRNA uridine-5-carboxymethylaminomethyl(34) synthesis GTPase MnmE [Rickettsiales bacterium]